jgi:flagellar hook-associated protein 3 FlgL
VTIDAVRPVITTPTVLAGSMAGNLTTDESSIATLETEISTGYSVTVASDDPAQAANILQLQSGVTRARKYATNAQDGVSWLTLANSTVNSILTTLQQVQSAVTALTGYETTGDSGAVTGVSTVVTGALHQLIDLANTQYAGQAIFSGTGTPTKAYSTNGIYLGAGTPPTRTVAPGTQVAISVTGVAIFGTTGPNGLLSRTPTAGLGVLAQIVTELQKGTAASINKAATTGLAAVQAAMETVEAQAGKLGADQVAMEGFTSEATSSATALEQELGAAQDVTMAQAITNLQLQQTSYQAALYITSQLDTESLVNYLG